jgi:hypothetical protein
VTWIEPISTVITAAELANKLAASSSFIRKHANRLIYRIKNGDLVVPIFGAGGAGKSTAARMLAGEDPLDVVAAYDESWWIEPVKLKGDIPGTILVAPGQIVRADRAWPELFQYVIAGAAIGVINVVSFGFHSFNIESYKEHDLFETGMSLDQFLIVYLRARRALEVDMLEKLIHGLSAARNPMWMVTLVTKQDLWWDKRLEVKDFYENGPYSKKIDEFARSLGQRAFQHESLPVSLTIGNMSTPSGETIANTVSGYDMARHVSYLQSMFSKLNEATEQRFSNA